MFMSLYKKMEKKVFYTIYNDTMGIHNQWNAIFKMINLDYYFLFLFISIVFKGSLHTNVSHTPCPIIITMFPI